MAVLLALAALAWWLTAARTGSMDAGPGTDLGALGWFLGVWVVMMAAMMLPSLAPTVALYARMTHARDWAGPLLFAGGYLLMWSAGALLSYGLFRLGKSVLGGDLAWYSGGRFAAGGVLAVAALYELTPLKLSAWRSAAGRWGSCSGPGATGASVRSGWDPGTRRGVSAAAGG